MKNYNVENLVIYYTGGKWRGHRTCPKTGHYIWIDNKGYETLDELLKDKE